MGFYCLFHRTIWNARYLQAVRRIQRRKGEMSKGENIFFFSHYWFPRDLIFSIRNQKFIWGQQQVLEVCHQLGSCSEVSMKLQKPNSDSPPNNRTLLPRNSRFLTSVNQFSRLNIWIWEIEWGDPSSAPTPQKIENSKKFIHNFILLTQINILHYLREALL